MNDDQKYSFKIQLVKRLFKRRFSKKRISRLLEFIKNYTKFDRSELYQVLEEEINPIRKKMGIKELIEKNIKDEGLQQGLQQGKH